jgi:GDP-L-fucose synthase
MMEKDAKIFVAGHRGMVGSAILRRLKKEGFKNFVLRDSKQADLRDQRTVSRLFCEERPDYVFLSAARVGGIRANSIYPADFIYDNLAIETNVIHQAYEYDVRKLLFLGSSCIYPKYASQPIKEDSLLTGALEPTNEFYAIAKIAGIKMCTAYAQQYECKFISAMPTNLYGPNDNYDLANSHVLPALIRKFFEAKKKLSPTVEVWGSGNPRREFLHVDDLADACLFLMQHYDSPEIINVGTGKDITIKNLAFLIKECTGYDGELEFDPSQPDGTPQKLLDVSKINELGWSAQISLRNGVKNTCDQYAASQSDMPVMEFL